MKPIQENEIAKFLKENVEPLKSDTYGSGYRASVTLLDGTFLPCVIFRNAKIFAELAITRFKEEQTNPKFGYYNIVRSFVTRGNCITPMILAMSKKVNMPFHFQY